MVAFDTVTPRSSGLRDAERPLAEWLRETAEEWGFCYEWQPIDSSLQPNDGLGDLTPNLLVWPPSSEELAAAGRSWLIFDGHLDTVSLDGMTVPPLGDSVELSDRIVGRGACDAKGAGAAMLWALKEAAEGGAAKGPVAVLFTIGEESDQRGAQSFARFGAPRLREARGWDVGAMIVGEPTGMNAVAATGGFLRWKITTRGVAAHSSRPERGRNAIDAMVRLLARLKSDYIDRLDTSHPLAGRAACSVTLIEGGTQHNIIPEACTVTVDRRLVPGESPDHELAAASAVLEGMGQGAEGILAEHHDIESAVPMEHPANERLAAWAIAALELAGISAKRTGEPFTTNANHYTETGLPALVIGPGDIRQAHTKEEHLSLADLSAGVRGYRNLMRSWCGDGLASD